MSRLPRHTTVFARAHTHTCVFAAARGFADLRTILVGRCVRRRRRHYAARNRRRSRFIRRICESAYWRVGWHGRRQLDYAANDHHGHFAFGTSRHQLLDHAAIHWWAVSCAVDCRERKPASGNQSFPVRLPLRCRGGGGKLHLHGASGRFVATKGHTAIQSDGDHGRPCDHHCIAAECDAEHGLQLPDPDQ
jgi:hypothetical protein